MLSGKGIRPALRRSLAGSFHPNVHRGRMVQQTVEDRGSDNRIAEDRTPFAIALLDVRIMLPLS